MDVFFHVVASVKGGSGKSTVALLLADYLSFKNETAYIIDLDVCGTSWLKDYEFAFSPKPTKFINRMMYQSCTKGYGDDVWSKLKVCGVGGTNGTSREIKVCLAANEQLSHSINKSDAELVEHTTYHLIMDAIRCSERDGKSKMHIIFDLPPSHETTVEQICHHLLFDHRSVLKQKVKGYKVFFYMISPADQGSALGKNIDYLYAFSSNPTYSESMKNRNWYAWQIINDNHNWADVQGESVAKPALEGLKRVAKAKICEAKLDDSRVEALAMSFCKFNYKKGYLFGEYTAAELGLTIAEVADEDKSCLNIHGYDQTPFIEIYKKMEL